MDERGEREEGTKFKMDSSTTSPCKSNSSIYIVKIVVFSRRERLRVCPLLRRKSDRERERGEEREREREEKRELEFFVCL